MPRRLLASFLPLLIPFAAWAGDRPWTLDAIMALKTVADPRISPDGEQIAYVVRSENRERNAYDSQIRIVDAGGKSDLPLAGSHYSDHSPRWAPDGRRLAFLSRRDGSSQVYVSDLADPGVQKLTNAATGATHFVWSPDAKSIGYLAVDPIGDEEAARIKAGDDAIVRGENLKYSRIYAVPAEGGEARLVTKQDHHITSFDWSPDGTRMVYASQKTPERRWAFYVDLYEVNVATGKATGLVTQEGRDASPSYSPDGKRIVFHTQGGTSNYFAERDVAIVPSGGGPIQGLKSLYEGDVFRGGDSHWWSEDGSRIIFGAGWSTRYHLLEVDLKQQEGRKLPLDPTYPSAFSVSRDGGRVAFIQMSNNTPPEVAVADLPSGGGTANVRQVSNVNPHAANYPPLRTETISWKSKDGSRVEGVLRYPIGSREGERVPLLVQLHGGPTGVATEGYPIPRTYPTQLFAQEGFAILEPNFRGSSNYGAEWRLKNIESQGFGDFDDVMTGVDHLIEKGVADPDRLGVMGWSYGGYLTSWVIGHTHRFKAASIGAPATDWITYYGEFYGAHEVLWTYFGGNPWDHGENYIRHSSRRGLTTAKTPSLLQRGDNDSEHNPEIHQILSDRGVPVEMVTYPREGHGIREPMHHRDLMKRNLSWFRKWVLRKGE